MEKVKRRNIKFRTLPTYQVGTKLYKTLRAAARAEAWAIICGKYCNGFSVTKLSDVRNLHGMTCDCHDTDYGETDGNTCDIHCRHYGYFAKLHARLVRLIEKDYEGL